jgi:hypothetical protein
MGPLAYLAGQCGILLIFWFIAWFWAMVEHHPLREANPGLRYLWWLSAPMFLCFFAFSFKTGGGEVNWPVTAYLSGMVLAAGWLERQLEAPQRWWRRLTRINLTLACSLGLALTLFVHRSDWLFPLFEQFVGPPSATNLVPVRRLDPTCRLRGWHALGAEIDRLRDQLRADGEDPVLAAANWSVPGEIGLYCRGNPQAYSIGLLQDDRHSQYDFWPSPVNNPESYLGRTFIVIGQVDGWRVRAGFAKIERTMMYLHYEAGQPIAYWGLTVCRGFKGFPPDPEMEDYYRY